jgi:hypothetical protein
VAALVISLNVPARAEIVFGQRNECSGSTDASLEFSRQGRFFATTDYADAGNDFGVLTRARNIANPGVFPAYNRPWNSDGGRTLFGVEFDNPLKPNYPGQFGPSTNIVPLFTRAEIQWKENVPSKNAWSACIRTHEGKLVKLNTGADKTIFSFDRTTVTFEPTAIKTFLIGLKGREDGIVNYADVLDIRLFIPPERSSLTNKMAVWDPGFYLAVFSPVIPGMIEGLTPVNSYCASHHTLYYHGQYSFDLFFPDGPLHRVQGNQPFRGQKGLPGKGGKKRGQRRGRICPGLRPARRKAG